MHNSLKLMTEPSPDALNEMFIYRYANGVRVATHPCSASQPEFLHNPLISMQELMHLPFNIYFNDLNHKNVQTNDALWQQCGLNSKNEILGTCVDDFTSNKSQAMKIYSNNEQVVHEQSLCIFDEETDLDSNVHINAISFKMPWYDNDDSIVGIFGCSIMLANDGVKNLASQLSSITNLFLKNPKNTINALPGKELNHIYLTRRETEMINLIVRGKTMREVGLALNISTRTAENYFACLKEKIGAKSKSEFVDKVIDYYR